MKRIFLVICIAASFVLPSKLFCQWVCLGKSGKGCTQEELRETCDAEETPPNLFVDKPVKLKGVLLDETGARVIFEKSVPEIKTVIQVIDPKKGSVLVSVPLGIDGEFDLGLVPAGVFRIIAVWAKDGKYQRLPLAEQPKAMKCSKADRCWVYAVVHFHGTDNPIDSCPPK